MTSTKRTRANRGSSIPRARRAAGRTERGVEAAIRASRDGGKAEPGRAAIEAVTRLAARALDGAADDPYAVAQLLPRVLDVMTCAGLIPEPKGSADDSLAALLSAMAAPTVGHQAEPWEQ
uniref:TetR family transcriptional regulator n=1 Tax=Streptomyces sp. NBC_00003 TaxID=2903608 RepID=A0AAU2V7Q7_9ACTN